MKNELQLLCEDYFKKSYNHSEPNVWMFSFVDDFILTKEDKEHPLYMVVRNLIKTSQDFEKVVKIYLVSRYWLIQRRKNFGMAHPAFLLLLYIALMSDNTSLSRDKVKNIMKVLSELPCENAATLSWSVLQIARTLEHSDDIQLTLQALKEHASQNEKISFVLEAIPFVHDLPMLLTWLPHTAEESIGERFLKNHIHNTPEGKLSIIELKCKPVSMTGIQLKEEWKKSLLWEFEQKLDF